MTVLSIAERRTQVEDKIEQLKLVRGGALLDGKPDGTNNLSIAEPRRRA